MNSTALEKRRSTAVKEKAQYAGAFGIIAVMLWVAGFPPFLLFFIGVLTFFIWKVFSSESRNETRRIFEFYLTANEILREDDRRWYGFEIQEAVDRGENIIRSMNAAPPLVSFALGALYHKLEDHSAAVRHLTNVAGDEAYRESAIVYPSRELREYVRMLRKIERAPAEAPLTSSAIRALERARRARAKKLLDESREKAASRVVEVAQLPSTGDRPENPGSITVDDASEAGDSPALDVTAVDTARISDAPPPKNGRKTISEVLHDIYDGNVQ